MKLLARKDDRKKNYSEFDDAMRVKKARSSNRNALSAYSSMFLCLQDRLYRAYLEDLSLGVVILKASKICLQDTI